MRRLTECIASPFIKGLLCGGILVLMLFVSWKTMLFLLGAAAVYVLIRFVK